MTPEQLATIEARASDPTTNWNVLIVQQDRNALLAEVKRLQRKLQDTTGVVPDPGGGDWVNGAFYDCKPCFECGETDQTHDFKCSKHPSNAPKPATDNAVTGDLSRDPDESRRRLDRILRRNPHGEGCDYRGALAECHSLDCPVHGKNKP